MNFRKYGMTDNGLAQSRSRSYTTASTAESFQSHTTTTERSRSRVAAYFGIRSHVAEDVRGQAAVRSLVM